MSAKAQILKPEAHVLCVLGPLLFPAIQHSSGLKSHLQRTQLNSQRCSGKEGNLSKALGPVTCHSFTTICTAFQRSVCLPRHDPTWPHRLGLRCCHTSCIQTRSRCSKTLKLSFLTLKPGVFSVHRMACPARLCSPLRKGEQGPKGLGARAVRCEVKPEGMWVQLECTGQVTADHGDQNHFTAHSGHACVLGPRRQLVGVTSVG